MRSDSANDDHEGHSTNNTAPRSLPLHMTMGHASSTYNGSSPPRRHVGSSTSPNRRRLSSSPRYQEEDKRDEGRPEHFNESEPPGSVSKYSSSRKKYYNGNLPNHTSTQNGNMTYYSTDHLNKMNATNDLNYYKQNKRYVPTNVGGNGKPSKIKLSTRTIVFVVTVITVFVACYSTLTLHTAMIQQNTHDNTSSSGLPPTPKSKSVRRATTSSISSPIAANDQFYTFTDPNTDLIVKSTLTSFNNQGRQPRPRMIDYVNTSTNSSLFKQPSSSKERIIDDVMLELEVPPLEHSRAVEAIQGDCVPMVEWHTQSRPNCNMLHELDLRQGSVSKAALVALEEDLYLTKDDSSETNHVATAWDHSTFSKMEGWADFLGQGWFRQAWELDENKKGSNNDNESDDNNVILKMLRYERDYHEEYYDLHRRDAMAMERLTSSKYTLNVYGYCGQSAINEKAVDNVERVFMRLRKGHYDYKLKVAAAVARAVADVHTIDYTNGNNATLVHYDLNPRNVAIMPDGSPKLNDFNVAEFLRWNISSDKPCGFQGRLYEPWWRAPEEMICSDDDATDKHLIYHPSPKPSLTEKVDVYSLGNILYRIMTGSAPRGKSIPERLFEIRDQVGQGVPPSLAEPHLSTKDPNAIALRKALRMCYEPDPLSRNTSVEIAHFLETSLKLVQGPEALQHSSFEWPFDTPPVTRKDKMKTNPHPKKTTKKPKEEEKKPATTKESATKTKKT